MYDRQLRLGNQRAAPQVAPFQPDYALTQSSGTVTVSTSAASVTLLNTGGLTVLKAYFVLSAATASSRVWLYIGYLNTVPNQVFGTFGQTGSVEFLTTPISINAGFIVTQASITGVIGDTYTFQGVL